MLRMSSFIGLLLFSSALLLSVNSYAQMINCGPLVSLEDGVIIVEPAPDDDTEEIQCALESAGALGITTVKLTSGLYAISHVMVENFVGTFEGRSKEATTLFIFDDSVDCGAALDSGRVPAAFKFVNGNVKFAKMNVTVNQPCDQNNASDFVLIHFTGSHANSGCGGETGFGQVDRVDIFSESALNGIRNTAVAAYAEGVYFGTCRDTQLGTFKLNRSLIAGFARGLDLSLRGSGQVDVNFSEFIANEDSIITDNANQLLTVQSNTFLFPASSPYTAHFGVRVRNFMGPTENRVVIYNNDFGWEGEFDAGLGFGISADEGIATSAAVSNNNFHVMGSLNSPLGLMVGINGASISGNTFQGSTMAGIELLGASRGNVITSNNFAQLNPSIGDNVYFGAGASNNIVGPLQSAIVVDDDGGNFILGPQFLQPDDEIKPQVMLERSDAFSGLEQRVMNARNTIASLTALKGMSQY